MSDPMSVLVTGSGGRVGQAACDGLLARGHRVRGFDVRPSPAVEDEIVGDISDASQVRKAMAGVAVVVHLAATPDEDDFLGKLLPNNIVGLYSVLENARQMRVRRIILASTGQVVMGHEGPWPITPEMPFSPRNWYGSAKVLAEVAGQVYAHVHGLSVIVARLGWCPRDKEHADELSRDEFGKDVYFSPGDAGRFFACAVEASTTIKYAVVFATSKPLKKARYDISGSRDLLGYEPQDTWPQGTEIVNQ
ncbi:MAG: NAD(P)-dependent oxidoreductase [Planctomycetes bacterium]|nr:NAD(P)-dependent oxidoreductase [Planctomycetota bacterium]